MKIKTTLLFLFTAFASHAQLLDWAVSRNLQAGSSHLPIDMRASHFSDANFITGFSYADSMMSGVPLQVGPAYGFLIKVNAQGDTLWKWNNTTTITGSGSGLFPSSLAVDDQDNIYVAGIYSMSAPGFTMEIGSYPMPISPYYYGGFVAKFDSSGNVVWVQAISAPVNYNDIDIDAYGNVYILGNVQSGVTYGSTNIHTSASNLYRDFIVSYDSSGALLWAKGYGEVDLNNTFVTNKGTLIKIAVDKGPVPEIYAAGYFLTPYDANGAVFTSAGLEDALVIKLDQNGNYVGGLQAGSTHTETFYDIAINEHSEIALALTYRTSTDINGVTYTAGGSLYHTMLIKIDSSLNYKWVNDALLSAFQPAVAIDPSGICAISVGNSFSNPTSTLDYLQVYDSSGTLMFSKQFTGTGSVAFSGCNFFAMDFQQLNNKTLYMAGDYKPQMIIDNDTLNCMQSHNFEISLLKFELNAVPTSASSPSINKAGVSIFPNPVSDILMVNIPVSQNAAISLYTLCGQLILSKELTPGLTKVDVHALTSGVYFTRIMLDGKVSFKKFVKE